MREIIYVQAGPVSNYTGIHYWNTQENYFTYDEGEDIPLTDHSVSFKEGRDPHNNPTLCPRVLIFDHKSNFGTLAKDQGNSEPDDLQNSVPSWGGAILHQEQERIPQSEYHALLETDGRPDATDLDMPSETKIRFWSDYSRVYFDPKSVQAVPDALQIVEGDWNANQELFRRYDEDTELMEGPLRLLIEDCDNFQGLQMMHDNVAFGGFSNSFLRSFRDEYRKTSIMAFAVLADIHPNDAEIGYTPHTKKIINDALCLEGLYEFSSLTIPVLTPALWKQSAMSPICTIDSTNLYRSSAVLSAIAESATLPLRLRGGLDDLQSYISHLNWSRVSPFAQLCGSFLPDGRLKRDDILATMQLSLYSQESCMPYACRDVSRGFDQEDLSVYESWTDDSRLRHPLLMSHHGPAYPIPTSFPAIFSPPSSKSIKLLSSIKTSPSIAAPLSRYATFVQDAMRRGDIAFMTLGLEQDDVKELVGTLWQVVDSYDSAELGEGSGTELGEDEE